MRWFNRLLVLLLLSIPLAVVALAILCTSSTQLIAGDASLGAGNVARARALLHEHDPRKLRSGEKKTVAMNEEELNLAFNHVADQLGGGAALVTLGNRQLDLIASIELAKLLPERYLNIELQLATVDGSVNIERLKLGRVVFPRALVGVVSRFIIAHIYRASGVDGAADVIQAVAIRADELNVSYEWKAGIVAAVRDRIVDSDDRERLRAYHELIYDEVLKHGENLSFSGLLEALFRLATVRSLESDASAENRAAIMVLAAYVNRNDLSALVPDAADWDAPRYVRMRIQKRIDFAQHFSSSAALAVTGGDAISRAIGLYKEIDDADGGSGFSFRDLAADMAGTRFGLVAVADNESASALQTRLLEGINDLDLIPDVSGLEEGLTDKEFVARYGGVGGSRYSAVVTDIEQRIARLRLHQ